jgi:para-aminobenzoate synthetase component II
MGIRHTRFAIDGVQFHPEAVLTEGGHRLLANWLTSCGLTTALSALATVAGTEGRAEAR